LRVSDPRGRVVVLTTVLGSGVAVLDSTILNVALRPRSAATWEPTWRASSGSSVATP